ncbi:MAG: hypothetical protein Q9O62_07740 [Ardenticatenia bacterium]|nr:hypothetical protein [Ardenticatenia bacterium]
MADIVYLIDRLEDVLNKGFRVPFTSSAVIDEEAFLDVVDQMRIAIPNEIREAQRILQERERILADARQEAERIVAEARLKAQQMVEEQAILEQARQRARQIEVEAARAAEEVRRGADQYALEVLEGLQAELHRILRTVENGMNTLKEQRGGQARRVEAARRRQ